MISGAHRSILPTIGRNGNAAMLLVLLLAIFGICCGYGIFADPASNGLGMVPILWVALAMVLLFSSHHFMAGGLHLGGHALLGSPPR